MFKVEYFDYLGKNKNNFSFTDIITEMKYGLITLGLITTVQTIAFVYYLYSKNSDPDSDKIQLLENPVILDKDEIQLEDIQDLLEESTEEILQTNIIPILIDEKLKMLSLKKTELLEIYNNILYIQNNIYLTKNKLDNFNE
jgi:hypothetical protein